MHDARYVFGELNTWGWFLVALGVVQLFAAIYGPLAYGRGRRAARRAQARADRRPAR